MYCGEKGGKSSFVGFAVFQSESLWSFGNWGERERDEWREKLEAGQHQGCAACPPVGGRGSEEGTQE